MTEVKIGELSNSERELINYAIKIRENAYCPYSNFKVGAAIIDSIGNIHTGCNIESADYTLTTHAEMLAIDSMIKSGNQKPIALAIALYSEKGFSTPCGLCRQKLSEFGDENCKIIMVSLNETNNVTSIYIASLGELLPYCFSKEFIN
jgi:cytidine deaminase